jgi:hypothetical protein
VPPGLDSTLFSFSETGERIAEVRTSCALADELWPLLEAKIERALDRKTERRIPIVRVVDLAAALAHELPDATW